MMNLLRNYRSRRLNLASTMVFVLVASGVLWRGTARNSIASRRTLWHAVQKRVSAPRAVRSMIALDDEASGQTGWTAVWCYVPRVRVETVYGWKRNVSVEARVEALSQAARASSGDEWAAMNGGYFDWNRHEQPRRAIIGSVGNGRRERWSDGSPPSSRGRRFQRWAFGVAQNNGETRFRSALMQPRVGRPGFWVPENMERDCLYGLSGLMCLLREGQAMVWRDGHQEVQALPKGQWNGRTEFLDGAFRRAAVAWSRDGRHLFLVVQQKPNSVLQTRDLFARYQGRRYLGPGPVLKALRQAFSRLPENERPCSLSQLPDRIENAMLLDGGHCATVKYRRLVSGQGLHRARDYGSWQTGPPWQLDSPRVPTTLEVSEKSEGSQP